jgi:hypothetical protein
VICCIELSSSGFLSDVVWEMEEDAVGICVPSPPVVFLSFSLLAETFG